MPGKRRPMDVNLSVVGGKHWTKDEIEDRTNGEVKVPKPKTLTPPSWLNADAKKLFRKYAKQLLAFPSGIVSTLDAGTLARYCDCELSYAEASKHKSFWLEVCHRRLEAICQPDAVATSEDDSERYAEAYKEAESQVSYWTKQMGKFEKICRGCASEMGLTVASRCRLVVPKVAQEQEENPLEALRQKMLGG